ncbi:MAG TPA: RagB/SusD family nutrient uptake outer membrane protein, partial [Bacteroidales bacterium]|nr:RagB/SusD family nutrient uptake outer membrane protein [Bacteroidales bacterium]
SYKGILARSQESSALTPFGALKYLDESRAIVHERHYSSTDYIVFRLGEIYLNYAEASMELGKDGDALWAVNEIRKRAGMPELATITRDKVRQERKIELAFEG